MGIVFKMLHRYQAGCFPANVRARGYILTPIGSSFRVHVSNSIFMFIWRSVQKCNQLALLPFKDSQFLFYNKWTSAHLSHLHTRSSCGRWSTRSFAPLALGFTFNTSFSNQSNGTPMASIRWALINVRRIFSMTKTQQTCMCSTLPSSV